MKFQREVAIRTAEVALSHFRNRRQQSPLRNSVCGTLSTTGLCSLLLGIVCLFCLLLGLGFTTTSGNYWFTIFNDYAATFSLLFIVLFEVIIVSYVYGIKRFVRCFVSVQYSIL